MTRIDMMQMASRPKPPVNQSGQTDRKETDFLQMLKGKRPSDDEGGEVKEKPSFTTKKESAKEEKDSEFTDRIPEAPDLPDTILSQLMSILQLQNEKNTNVGGEWIQAAVSEEESKETAGIIPAEFTAPAVEELPLPNGGMQEENTETLTANMVTAMPEGNDLKDIAPQDNVANGAEEAVMPEAVKETGVPVKETHASPPEEKISQESIIPQQPSEPHAAKEGHTEPSGGDGREDAAPENDDRSSKEKPVPVGEAQPQHAELRGHLKSFVSKAEGGGSPDTVKTTQADLPADLGRHLASRLPEKNGTLTIELEPASLGKVLVKVVYEAGRASVSLMAENPRTLEILSRNAGEIAGILENRTGQETVIHTAQAESQYADSREEGGRQESREQEQKEHRKPKNQSDSFVQQLRLGLV